MDVARRADDLAGALVRGYRAAGGDAGDDRLLSFLCAVRALVRAKVDLLRAGQLSGAAADEPSARGYELLSLAERYAWRARLPRIVCVIGHAASGKSTLAEALATASCRTVLSSDRTRQLRAGVPPYEYAGPQATAMPTKGSRRRWRKRSATAASLRRRRRPRHDRLSAQPHAGKRRARLGRDRSVGDGARRALAREPAGRP